MLAQGLMSRDLVTFKANTSVAEALKIMEKQNYRRIPVVDKAGRPIGLITQPRLRQVLPKAGTPLVWQMRYLLSHTTVGDVMRKDVITVRPMDTVEKVVAVTQASRVGTALVVDEAGKLVGIVSTNDIFFRIVNPTLGIAEPGTRILIDGAGDGPTAEKILGALNKLGVEIKLIWTSVSSTSDCKDLTVQIDSEHEKVACEALTGMKFQFEVRQR